MNVFSALVGVLFTEKSSSRFAFGVIVGVGFSIAVILSTVGIMDGFDASLRQGLKASMGDVYFYSRDGFFPFKGQLKKDLKDLEVAKYTGYIQTEAFLVHDETSRGVSIRGIDEISFELVTGMDLEIPDGSIAIGSELASLLNLKIGDEIVLAFAKGNQGVATLPLLKNFKVSQIVKHGVYQKDLRYIYMPLPSLRNVMDIENEINVVALSLPASYDGLKGEERINGTNDFIFEMEERLGFDYTIKPYWYDFGSLLDAVAFEKNAISLILQIIVIISIFNVLAFVVFINEKRAREMFLFQALGMSRGKIFKLWLLLVVLIWIFSCALSWFFVKIFGFLLANLAIFQLPGDVYHLGTLTLEISLMDYGIVFSLALLWLFLISTVGLIRIKRRSILHGLRREFV